MRRQEPSTFDWVFDISSFSSESLKLILHDRIQTNACNQISGVAGILDFRDILHLWESSQDSTVGRQRPCQGRSNGDADDADSIICVDVPPPNHPATFGADALIRTVSRRSRSSADRIIDIRNLQSRSFNGRSETTPFNEPNDVTKTRRKRVAAAAAAAGSQGVRLSAEQQVD